MSSSTERRTDNRRDEDHRLRSKWPYTYRYTIGYVVLVLWTAFLFWLIGENADDRLESDREIIAQVEREALARDYSICLRSNEVREAVLHFVEEFAAFMGDGPIEDRLIEQAREDFAPLPCPPPPVEEEEG